MFGFFKRRAIQRAARKADALALTKAVLHEKLTAELDDILKSALSQSGVTPEQAEDYKRNAAAMRRGIDAMLLPGADVRQLDIEDWPTRCAAVLAHASLNANPASRAGADVCFEPVSREASCDFAMRFKSPTARSGGEARLFSMSQNDLAAVASHHTECAG